MRKKRLRTCSQRRATMLMNNVLHCFLAVRYSLSNHISSKRMTVWILVLSGCICGLLGWLLTFLGHFFCWSCCRHLFWSWNSAKKELWNHKFQTRSKIRNLNGIYSVAKNEIHMELVSMEKNFLKGLNCYNFLLEISSQPTRVQPLLSVELKSYQLPWELTSSLTNWWVAWWPM